MDDPKDFIRRESERLKSCWAAFLSPLSKLQLPLPSTYAQEFARAESLPEEKKEHVLAKLLRDTQEVLEWLLSQGEIREVVLKKGRLSELEEVIKRIRDLETQVNYLREELLRDDLTKLWNRRALQVFFQKIVRDISDGRRLYLMVFLDLCDLKKINDLFGHSVGDQVLVKMAKRLKTFTKRVDIPVRLGGDEFVLLLAAPSLEVVEPFLFELTSEPIVLRCGQKVMEVYPACGATDILGEDTLETCLHRADLAMYRHKTEVKRWIKEGKRCEFPKPVLLRALKRDL